MSDNSIAIIFLLTGIYLLLLSVTGKLHAGGRGGSPVIAIFPGWMRLLLFTVSVVLFGFAMHFGREFLSK